MKCLVILVSIIAFGLASDEDPHCSIPGQCIDSELIKPEVDQDEKSCLSECKSTEECLWYTFDTSNGLCELFKNCVDISIDECPDCISGRVDCPLYQCGLAGSCQVT